VNRFRRGYGAGPAHLLLMLGCLALAGYAAVRLLTGRTLAVALWFAGGALLHDLVLLPLYAGADRGARELLAPGRPDGPRVWWINHLRVPVVLSGLLLLVWFPLILRQAEPYRADTGLSEGVFLGRWLAVTAALAAASAGFLAARLHRRGAPRRQARRAARRAERAERAEDAARRDDR
jgi:hypothetical protein